MEVQTSHELFVRNLSYDTTEEDLKTFFKDAGPINKFIIIKDPQGQSKGFGFVHFKLGIDAEKACKELNKKQLKGRKVTLEVVKEGYKHDKPEKKVKENHEIMIKGLSFKKSSADIEKILQETFSKFGKIKNMKIPANKEDKTKNLGYAFIEFLKPNSASQAVLGMNGKMLDGLELHVDFKMSREEYLAKKEGSSKKTDIKTEKKSQETSKVDKIEIDDNDQEEGGSGDESDASDANDDQLMKDFLSKLVPEDEDDLEKLNKDLDDMPQVDEEALSDQEDLTAPKPKKKKAPQDPKEELKQTIFLKNLPIEATKEQVSKIFSKFGPVAYVALVKNKKTGNNNGTAFVKFAYIRGYEKLFARISEVQRLTSLEDLTSTKKKSKKDSFAYDEFNIDGRPFIVLPAIEKEKAEKIRESHNEPEDKRNIKLMQIGLLHPKSAEAQKLPPQLLEKIKQKFALKQKKLQDPNNRVSRTRLSVSNLAKNVDDKDLKALFKEMSPKGSNIVQVKIVKDEDGSSKGYGFVEFEKHEDALEALKKISNNVKMKGQILIVEFAIENSRKVQKLMDTMKRGKSTSQKYKQAESLEDFQKRMEAKALPSKRKRQGRGGPRKRTKQ